MYVDNLWGWSMHETSSVGQGLRRQHIALVNMPFAQTAMPSIQCGLLKAILQREGHVVDVHYLNLEIAVLLGHETYSAIANYTLRDLLFGDWLFSAAAFGYKATERPYLDMGRKSDGSTVFPMDEEKATRFRNVIAPAMVEQWATSIPWDRYDLIGFTCTFEQTVASYALGRRIKELYPERKLVYGGALFDGDMAREHVRAFPWVDYAVSGEGDHALPELVRRLGTGEDPAEIPGVVSRTSNGRGGSGPASPVQDMDALPYPNYSDYFAAVGRLGRQRVLGEKWLTLPFEGSRGCWWGEKQHCVFCSFNEHGIGYRSKTPGRVLDELRHLSNAYQVSIFTAVDSIMNSKYVDGLCRPIADEMLDYTFFFEVKANLTREQIRVLSRAGVRTIQPGLESLSTSLLGAMHKGTSMLLNVRCLKWARYYDIAVAWNSLAGLPGETKEAYRDQARIFDLLHHLPPPQQCGAISIDRFSPIFEAGNCIEDLAPHPAYNFIWPQEMVDVGKVAYFFKGKIRDALSKECYAPMLEAGARWRESWSGSARPSLTYARTPDWIQVIDSRIPEKLETHFLREERARAYQFCDDTHRSLVDVRDHLISNGYLSGQAIDSATTRTREILGEFCELGLMVGERDCYLSLALPENDSW